MPVNRTDTRPLLVFIAILALGCAGSEPETPEQTADLASINWILPFIDGYLRAGSVPSSVSLLGAPPPSGSPAMQADQEANAMALSQRASPRWRQATKDASLSYPEATEDFACVLHAPISLWTTPTLYGLLLRAALDAGAATVEAKERYNRQRPFEVNREPICTPGDALSLRRDGSYPSAHSAVGWIWARLLSELAPERKDALLERGHEFGQSRVICNVHWQSDVEAGRAVADAVVERLHQTPEFEPDFATARREIELAHAWGLRPTHRCE